MGGVGRIESCFEQSVIGTEETLFDSGPPDFLQNSGRVEALVETQPLG